MPGTVTDAGDTAPNKTVDAEIDSKPPRESNVMSGVSNY